MSGFVITNLEHKKIKNDDLFNNSSKTYTEEKNYKDIHMKRTSLKSFANDKIFCEDENYIVIIEGVITNAKELIETYFGETFDNTVKKMISENSVFFSEFRGSFSGAIYNKHNNEWTIFVDQLSSRSLHYYCKDDKYIIGSNLIDVVKIMKLNGIEPKENKHGISCLLDWGYLIDDTTVVDGVKRVYAGDYVIIGANKEKVKTYYNVSDYDYFDWSTEECLEKLNDAFSKAVNRVINKNIENGYKTVIDVSGGLDSRLIAFTAEKLNLLDDCILITFAQSNTKEYEIANKVANTLGKDLIFRSLDSGNTMKQIDDIVLKNNGSSYYPGSLDCTSFFELFDNQIFGIELTGLMGDVRDSSMVTENGDAPPEVCDERYRTSRMFPLDKNSNYSNVKNRFKNHELFWLYTRGVMAALNTVMVRQKYIESITPYGDVDFMKIYLSIPWVKRVKEGLLLELMKNKHPKAVNIEYAATGVAAKYTNSTYQKIYSALRYRKGKIFKKNSRKLNMSPIQQWSEKKDIKEYTNLYYENTIDVIKCDDEIKFKIKKLFSSSNAMERAIALTVLSCYKLYL